MTEQQVINPFKSVGFCKISSSGKSLRLELRLENTIFDTFLYINLKSLARVLNGSQTETTVFELNGEEK
jgi:hypothetical protein